MYDINMTTTNCLFCDRFNSEKHLIITDNEFAYSGWDINPVSEGHALIVPKRHVLSFFELSDDEVLAIYELARETKEIIDAKYHPDAFNIGINDGEAAGRTVHHLHLHLIPRYAGDVPEPRGGVRHIIPGKGAY
jgi:diadenosine tetraphosphate (Ap4A) HIT family hydrolase